MEFAYIALVSVALCLASAFGVLRRKFGVVHVHGPSMHPHLNAGDRVIIARRPSNYARGDVVVITRPDSPGQIIKRIAAVAGDRFPGGLEAVPPNHVFVPGDNLPSSMDSRHFGFVPMDRVVGRMIRRLII
ncbi:signal peptidase I [Acrocarpospora sp. B8E8]|uniref:signal peptidase I n=1 Tax=Acrocarpospora sp. B8E8 TaxID=3153572 RepID=UPI00325E58C3